MAAAGLNSCDLKMPNSRSRRFWRLIPRKEAELRHMLTLNMLAGNHRESKCIIRFDLEWHTRPNSRSRRLWMVGYLFCIHLLVIYWFGHHMSEFVGRWDFSKVPAAFLAMIFFCVFANMVWYPVVVKISNCCCSYSCKQGQRKFCGMLFMDTCK